jgi:Domain of unknown function (DUF4288)
MAFIPNGATWYIAQVVLEITVENESQNVVHINYLLVQAESPEHAYEKALRLGSEHETTYLNEDKQRVTIAFRGLRNLTVIYEPFEQGAEILYEEKVDVSPEELHLLVRPKDSLGIFRPIERSPGPKYGSEEIRQEARKRAGGADIDF